MGMGDLPDWASRVGEAVGAAFTAGFKPDDKSSSKPSALDPVKKTPPSSGGSSWTQYLPYVAVGGAGLVILLMITKKR